MAEEQYFGLVDDIGVIVASSIRHSARAVRHHAIECEREYMLWEDNQNKTDQQIWRRIKREGYRVVPVLISRQEHEPK